MPTNSDQESRDPVEALAAEYLERRRNGECPRVDQYAADHPELADEIRDLFPTIAALEQLKQRPIGQPADGATPIESLQRLGDCRLVREIGRGGMGVVFEAEQRSLGRRVAVKLLPQPLQFGAARLQRFQREARMAAALSHPSIVPVYHVGEQDGLHYLVMQLIDGESLDVLTRLIARKVGPLDPSQLAHADGESAAEPGSRADLLASALLAGDFSRSSSRAQRPSDFGDAL
ncbi:MAG: protein kinase, partial [Planctomycetota bacterium]